MSFAVWCALHLADAAARLDRLADQMARARIRLEQDAGVWRAWREAEHYGGWVM